MTQNSFEVPPVSFARYLELLKRRRWQVLPASAGGLLIGFLVAFLIPRYYVTDAKVRYTGVLFDDNSRTEDDELAQFVAIADQEMTRYVEPTMQKLGLLGSREPRTDSEVRARRGKIDSFKDRVETVVDSGQGREYPLITIVFRDTDGTLCKAFVDDLAKQWIQAQLDTLSTENQLELDTENERVEERRKYKDSLVGQRNALLTAHNVDLDGVTTGVTRIGLEREIAEAQAELDRILSAQAEAEGDVEVARVRLQKTPERIPVKAQDADIDPQIKQAIAVANKAVEQLEVRLTNTEPTSRFYSSVQDALAKAKERREQLIAAALPEGVQEISKENPKFDENQTLLTAAQTRYDTLLKQEKIQIDAIDRLKSRVVVLGRVRGKLENLDTRIEEATELLREQQLTQREHQRTAAQIRNRSLFRFVPAEIPATPTDPNIVVVALTGSLVGLLAAIGLVLLIDVVRSTFKTLEDVEFSLPVPVLGSMAHIETTEERRAQVRSRTKIALVSGAFLVLIVAVLSIYFVAPTRLPTAVVDLLDNVIGAPE